MSKHPLFLSVADRSQLHGDVLQILYVPVSQIDLGRDLLDDNPKLHDMQLLVESIQEYGYADCAKWDSKLNDGSGGFVYGNGRTRAALAYLQHLQKENQKPPRGIGVHKESGEWYIPVKVGVDSKDELTARRFSFDHNLSNLSGGPVGAKDLANMFDATFREQMERLDELRSLPLAFDQDHLTALQAYDAIAEDDDPPPGSGQREIECPECGHRWMPERKTKRPGH